MQEHIAYDKTSTDSKLLMLQIITSHHQSLAVTTSHYQSPPVITSHHQSPPITICHYQPPPVTTSHDQSPPVTTSHHMWLPVNTWHYQLQPVTTSHHLSLQITTSQYPSDIGTDYSWYLHCHKHCITTIIIFVSQFQFKRARLRSFSAMCEANLSFKINIIIKDQILSKFEMIKTFKIWDDITYVWKKRATLLCY